MRRQVLLLIAMLGATSGFAQIDLSGEWSNLTHEDVNHRQLDRIPARIAPYLQALTPAANAAAATSASVLPCAFCALISALTWAAVMPLVNWAIAVVATNAIPTNMEIAVFFMDGPFVKVAINVSPKYLYGLPLLRRNIGRKQ